MGKTFVKTKELMENYCKSINKRLNDVINCNGGYTKYKLDIFIINIFIVIR